MDFYPKKANFWNLSWFAQKDSTKNVSEQQKKLSNRPQNPLNEKNKNPTSKQALKNRRKKGRKKS